MKKTDIEKLIKDLENVQKLVCKNNTCDHFNCPASIFGCYGDECAFEAVIEAIESIKSLDY